MLETVRNKYYAANPDVYDTVSDTIKRQIKDVLTIMLAKGTIVLDKKYKKDGLPVYTKGEEKEIVDRNTGEMLTIDDTSLENKIDADDISSIKRGIADRSMSKDYNDTGIDFG
jgi:hypothetical protein